MSTILPALLLLPEHMGALHSYEKLLVVLIAFGPFVVLGLAMRVAQRRARDEEDAGGAEDAAEVSGRPPTT